MITSLVNQSHNSKKAGLSSLFFCLPGHSLRLRGSKKASLKYDIENAHSKSHEKQEYRDSSLNLGDKLGTSYRHSDYSTICETDNARCKRILQSSFSSNSVLSGCIGGLAFFIEPNIDFDYKHIPPRTTVTYETEQGEKFRIVLYYALVFNQRGRFGKTASDCQVTIKTVEEPGLHVIPWSHEHGMEFEFPSKLNPRKLADVQKFLEENLFQVKTQTFSRGAGFPVVIAYGLELTQNLYLPTSIMHKTLNLERTDPDNPKMLEGSMPFVLVLSSPDIENKQSIPMMIIGNSWDKMKLGFPQKSKAVGGGMYRSRVFVKDLESSEEE